MDSSVYNKTTKRKNNLVTVPNVQMIQRISNIEQHQQETDERIDAIIEKIENFSPKLLLEQIFQTGCVWDAWSFISDLVRSAQQRIVLIDNFVDNRVLTN